MFLKNWFLPKKLQDTPQYWKDYLAFFAEAIPKNIPLEELRFVVFDTETTGFNVQTDKLLSIGAVRIVGGEINVADAFECYIQQDFEDKSGSVAIHGIMPKNHIEKCSEEAALQRFLAYCQGDILIGHHVGFDISVMNQLAKKHTDQKLKNVTFDTVMLYHRLKYPLHHEPLPTEDYTLDGLSRQFNIVASDRHTAAGDAFITAILFLKLIHELQKKGIKTLRDLR